MNAPFSQTLFQGLLSFFQLSSSTPQPEKPWIGAWTLLRADNFTALTDKLGNYLWLLLFIFAYKTYYN